MPSTVEDRSVLRDAETRSLAAAYANVINSLGGRAKFLAEMAMGAAAFASEPASCQRNPQGTLGVDFSGPPFGSAWRTPLWWTGGVKEDITGDWQGQRQVALVTTTAPLNMLVRFWNRPHALVPKGPHTRCYLTMRAYRATGTNAALTVRLGYDGHSNDSDPAMSAVMVATSAADTIFTPTTIWWNVVPGLNALRLQVTTDHDAVIMAASGYQKAKRSH